jgi:hypothetical protein
VKNGLGTGRNVFKFSAHTYIVVDSNDFADIQVDTYASHKRLRPRTTVPTLFGINRQFNYLIQGQVLCYLSNRGLQK